MLGCTFKFLSDFVVIFVGRSFCIHFDSICVVFFSFKKLVQLFGLIVTLLRGHEGLLKCTLVVNDENRGVGGYRENDDKEGKRSEVDMKP